MWNLLVRFILRKRVWNIIAIILLTIFMGYHASNIQLSYEMARMLPASDTVSIDYDNFKKQFGEDGSVMFVGVSDAKLFELSKFNAWYDLSYSIKETEGVEEVLSLCKLFTLSKNDSLSKFDFIPISKFKPRTQDEVDSIKKKIYSLPFYDGLIINKSTNATLMMITLDKKKLNTKSRVKLIKEIHEKVEQFSKKNNIEVHYSGLPYIRTMISKKIQDELKFFMLLSMLIASIALFAFFRSYKAVLFPMIIVVICVVWATGIIVLLGYKITILTGIIPPLTVIIAVENCIFLLNKYHFEYKLHGNKIKALSRAVQRIGLANLLTNAATAAGFAAFTVTGNKLLVEFGIVASLTILLIYIFTIILIPIIFSYLSPPSIKNVEHLDNKIIGRIIARIEHIVLNKRNWVYVALVVAIVVGVFGVTKLRTTGNIVDDIPKRDPMYVDLLFFEKNFKGIMPFEISIDTKKDKGVMRMPFIRKIDQLQKVVSEYPELSKPVSVAEVVKFAKQAFYNGDPEFYSIPDNSELAFMADYIPKVNNKKKTILNNFVDTAMRKTRVSIQMANISTIEIHKLRDNIRPRIDSIFDPAKYDVKITGSSVVFLEGTRYLTGNLIESLILAVIIIALLMAFLFSSLRMIILSLIPNLVPQLLTAAMMGYFDITIKPSTILIFSIALGISMDNTIQYLSRYRLELRKSKGNIKESVIFALGETGYSMVYSSIVLFLGFSIFSLSTFGGTQAMGFLVSFTLLTGMFTNLLILPSLLLTLDKFSTSRRFKKPFVELNIIKEESSNTEIK